MKTSVFRVVSQSDVTYIPSTKQEGGFTAQQIKVSVWIINNSIMDTVSNRGTTVF